MTKLIAIIILIIISSCSYINYAQIIPLARTAVIGVPDADLQEVDKFDFSFARMRMGRGSSSIFTLNKVENNNTFVWSNSSSEKIYTRYGRVIRTEGLLHNSYILTNHNNLDLKSINIQSGKISIMLEDPEAYIEQMIYRDKFENEEFINVFEKVISNPIRWSHTNEYKFSKNLNMVTYTKQYIHPNLPALEIEFFYKFN